MEDQSVLSVEKSHNTLQNLDIYVTRENLQETPKTLLTTPYHTKKYEDDVWNKK